MLERSVCFPVPPLTYSQSLLQRMTDEPCADLMGGGERGSVAEKPQALEKPYSLQCRDSISAEALHDMS